MGGGTTHKSDEVIVLFGGDGIRAEVADSLGVNLGGGVEAKTHRDVLVLKVTVDGLGAANNAAF